MEVHGGYGLMYRQIIRSMRSSTFVHDIIWFSDIMYVNGAMVSTHPPLL